jgi:hypothetical protein
MAIRLDHAPAPSPDPHMLHAATLADGVTKHLRAAKKSALVGYAAALERRLSDEAGGTQQALDRAEVQAHGLKLAFETANLWGAAHGSPSELVERIYRIGVESGVDSIMAETLSGDATATVAAPSIVPADFQTYTGASNGLRRLDA